MIWRERHWFGAAAAVLTGGLFLCSRDTGPIGPLVLIAPVAILVYAMSCKRAWLVTLAALAAGALGSLGFVFAYAPVFAPIVLVLWIVAQSLWFMLVVQLSRWTGGGAPAWAATLSYPLFASATEFLISLISPHGSFGAVGYALVDILPLLQVASIGGVAALSFVAALVPMAIAMLIVSPREWRKITAVAGIPLVLVCVFGFYRLTDNADGHVRVALAAIDALQDPDTQSEMQTTATARSYADLVRHLAADRPDIVVLPEKLFTLKPGWNDLAAAEMAQAATDISAPILTGFDEAVPDGRQLNTARLFSPRVAPYRYVKRKLVPGLEAEFTPGSEALTIGDRGIAICKDMDFAPMIREYGRRGVRLMLVPAWDFRADGRLHARMAVVRGVEYGFALARAAAWGRLTASDAYGRVISEMTTSEDHPVVLVADVRLSPPRRTVYSVLGDMLGWVAVPGAMLLMAMGLVRRIRRRTPTKIFSGV